MGGMEQLEEQGSVMSYTALSLPVIQHSCFDLGVQAHIVRATLGSCVVRNPVGRVDRDMQLADRSGRTHHYVSRCSQCT